MTARIPAEEAPEHTKISAILKMKLFRRKMRMASFGVESKLKWRGSRSATALQVSGKAASTYTTLTTVVTTDIVTTTVVGKKATTKAGAAPTPRAMTIMAYAMVRCCGSVTTSLINAKKTPLVSNAVYAASSKKYPQRVKPRNE